jgi:glutamate synthase (ferredoxin)
VLGCDMARQCHLNTCPTGIATQKPELRAKFRGKPQHVIDYFTQLALDVQRLLAKFGLPNLEAAVGRSDLLEQVRFDGNLDLTPMLAKPGRGARRWMGLSNDRPGGDSPLDEPWTTPALEAAQRGEAFYVKADITNEHRTVGARLAGELGKARARGDISSAPGKVDVTFDLTGTAGQSFGAFTAEGTKLILTGQANDFVGKGLSGGTLVLRAVGKAAERSEEHVLLGNVALYGATAGKLLAAGRAGERFAVRNSGVTAVIEGIGDHGCEYMTGGCVVILGGIGINFGAGMTGGEAWVLDEGGSVLAQKRFHEEFLEATPFEGCSVEQQTSLKALVEAQASDAHSAKAQHLLASWPHSAERFVHFVPKPQV